MVKKQKLKVHLRQTDKHPKQDAFIKSQAKRIIIKAGRRGGKTVGIAKKAVKAFIKGRRVLYGAPTIEQVGAFWFEVCKALDELIVSGAVKKNESEHTIEIPGTKQRIRAKTCWNANTLRGDFADLLILDEYQLMAEDTWEVVGAPMLMDNDGDAVFIFTPPSLVASGVSKAIDPRHASKMFKKAEADTSGRWETYHFSSHENPYISADALQEITKDMSLKSYRQEILAEDDDIEDSWLVYGSFNAGTNLINRFAVPEGWPRYTGHDFGGANPCALFVAQDPATGYFYIYHEYFPGSRSTHQHVEAFKQLTDGLTILKRVGGNPGEKGTEEEIRQGYGAEGWPIVAPKFNHVKPMIDRVISLFELNKVFIFNDLYGIIGDINNMMWDLDNEGHITNKIKDEHKYHHASCMRYILSDFTPETVSRIDYEASYGA